MKVRNVSLEFAPGKYVELTCHKNGSLDIHAYGPIHTYMVLCRRPNKSQLFETAKNIESACKCEIPNIDFTNLVNVIAAMTEAPNEDRH